MSDPYIYKREYVATRGVTHTEGSKVSEYVIYSDGNRVFSGIEIDGIKPYKLADRIASLMNQAYKFGNQDAMSAPVEYICRIGGVERRLT